MLRLRVQKPAPSCVLVSLIVSGWPEVAVRPAKYRLSA